MTDDAIQQTIENINDVTAPFRYPWMAIEAALKPLLDENAELRKKVDDLAVFVKSVSGETK